MTDVAYLYKITNTINDLVYFGVTKDPVARMRGHASSTTPTKSYLKNAIQKYGRDKFTLQILVKGTQAYCYELEKKAIEAFNTLSPNGYNLCSGGRGAIGIFGEKNGMYGRKHSPETLKKMSLKQSGRVASEETKAKMSASRTGLKRTPEQRQKMSAAKKLHWQNPVFRERRNATILANKQKKLAS